MNTAGLSKVVNIAGQPESHISIFETGIIFPALATILATAVTAFVVWIVFKKTLPWYINKQLKNLRDSYQQFKLIAFDQHNSPSLSTEVMRPSWDVNKNLSKSTIEELKVLSEKVFQNHNSPSIASRIARKKIKKTYNKVKLKNIYTGIVGPYYLFHSSDLYRAKFKSSYNGTKIECAVETIKKWMSNKLYTDSSRIGYLTGSISEGKSTLITNICEYYDLKFRSSKATKKTVHLVD